MNCIKIVMLTMLVVTTFIESAHVSVRWMRPTSMLASVIRMAKIKQGPDRLINNNVFNSRTLFARVNGDVLPFLPESTDASTKRRELLQQKKRDLDAANNLDYWKRCTMKATVALIMYGIVCDGSWFFYPVFMGIPYSVHLDGCARNYRDEAYAYAKSADEWKAENSDASFSPSDKAMLMHAHSSQDTQKALASDAVTWYCPHSDWTKLVGSRGVNMHHVCTPCGSADPQAFSVVTLFNTGIFCRSNGLRI